MLCCWDKEHEGVGSSWLLTQSTGRPTSHTCTELLGWIRSLCTTSAGEVFAHLIFHQALLAEQLRKSPSFQNAPKDN